MPQPPHLDPKGFRFDGGKTGVLLIHGFTGAPPEVRPMGESLHKAGYTVYGPCLPGHGTTVEDLNQRTWTEIVDAARAELEELKKHCDTVFVGGLSMGGLLTLRLGETADGIAGLIPMAAATVVNNPLRHFLPIARLVKRAWTKTGDPAEDLVDASQIDQLWCYDAFPVTAAYQLMKLLKHVRKDIGTIRQPILIFQGTQDQQVPVKAAHFIHDNVASADKELVLLEQSGHCLTVDAEREAVWQRAAKWIAAHEPKAS
jgi:carboxylesterase